MVEDLVRGADVVIDNYRPGVLAKFGLGHDALHAVNPAVVTCSLTGYGETGPDAQRAGYDYTIQALAGVMSLAGEPDGPPTKAGISYVDHSGGISAALGRVRGARGTVAYRDRHARRRQPLRRADLDAHLPRFVAAQPRRRLRAHRELCAPDAGARAELPHRRRPSRAVRRQRRHVATVRRRGRGSGVGGGALRDARGTARTPRRGDRRASSACCSPHRAASGRRASARSGVACGTVNDVAGALVEPQTRARGLVVQNEHPAYGRYEHVRGPLPTQGPDTLRPAPLLGEHTTDVLGRPRLLAGAGPRAARRRHPCLTRADRAAIRNADVSVVATRWPRAAALVRFLDHPPVVLGDPRASRRTRSRARRGRVARSGRRPAGLP